MTDWALTRLGDVATIFDGPHATPTKTSDGPWYLSISSLQRGRFDLSLSAHLSESDFPKWTRRVCPEKGDTLFSYETRVGEAAHWDLHERAALGRRMGLLRPNRDAVDPKFLTHAYLGPQFQELIRQKTVHGATVERLLIADMPNWPIALPPLDEQRRIAGVLGALDDLIDHNRQLAGRLEDLSRSVAGQATDVTSLGELARVQQLGQKQPEGPIEHYSLPAFDDGALPERTDGALIKSGKFPLVGPTVLISRLNPKWERCWMAYPEGAAFASTEFVTVHGFGVENEEVWAVASSTDFWNQMRSHVTGTTGSHQRVDKGAVMRMVIPDVRTLPGAARSLLRHCVRSAHELRHEAHELTVVRDELLPLLISGRVRVADVEGLVS